VVVLHLDKRAGELPEVRGVPYGQGGEVKRVRIHPNSPLIENGTIEGYGIAAQYVFLDSTGGLEPGPLPGRLSAVDHTVYIASRPYVDPPQQLLNSLPHPLLYTAVVPSLPMPPGQDPKVPHGTARLHRDLIEAARRGGAYSELEPRLRRQVNRWGRALTDRRVGLALGGGGAFGFAHIPLIERIEQAGIPIDLISGCSVGSGVGAYYAARGLNGLSEFLAEAGSVLFKRGIISSRMIGRFIDGVLGGIRLEDLEVPFYPVVVDIDTACQTTIRYGTVGQGVQASASFPGVFTPTIMEQRGSGQTRRRYRFVDGGVINIVPDDTLYVEGAQVAMASNVIPPPRSRQRTSGEWVKRVQGALNRVPGEVGALMRELDPVVRLDDVMRTMYIMMHAPVDWESRTADAKFRAIPGNYSPMQWHNGAEIARAQESEHLDRVVARLQASYRALRWRQHVARSSDTEFELEIVNPDPELDMSAEG
jgi:predicted acylesterase/phospholipase RssA